MIFDVFHTIKRIHKSYFIVVSHSIDSKITTLQIFYKIICKCYAIWSSAIRIVTVNSISCNFISFTVNYNSNSSMLQSSLNNSLVLKYFHHFCWCRRCCNVIVMNWSLKDTITYTASDQECFISVIL